MRRLFTLPAVALCALGFAAPAQAADISWSLNPDNAPSMQTLAASKTLQSVWLDEQACEGDGALMMRSRSATGWGAVTRVFKRCSREQRIGRPVLAQDSGTRAEFLVYSVADMGNAKRSGIYYTRVSKGGAGFSRARRLASTPEAFRPVTVSAAARSKRLWVMWQNPRSFDDRTPKFEVQAFQQPTGKAASANIAVGTGTFRSDAGEAAMQLHAARSGLVAVWTLTDIGGTTRTYVADTERYATSVRDRRRTGLNYRGEVGVSANTVVTVGEDRRIYRVREVRPDINDAPVVFDADIWSFASDRFRPIAGSAASRIGMATVSSRLSRQMLAFQVDKKRNIYLAYLDFSRYEAANEDAESCTAKDNYGALCVRGVAPNAPVPCVFVYKTTLAGQTTRAQVPWTFTPLANHGSSTIEWLLPTDADQGLGGFEALTTQFGRTRLLMRTGHQVISETGAIETGTYKYNVVLTDALQFSEVPSQNPDDYVQRLKIPGVAE